jgi:beta-glucanase (GH16 family)
MTTALNLTGYHLAFDDEFNSFTSSPNGTTGWDTTVFGATDQVGLRALGTQEYLSDSSVGVNPFSVGGGVLTITAAPGSNPAGKQYNSGVITTDGDFSQAYGYFEMRAELPQGAGMWPAFWMYPETGYGVRELDVLEAFGAPAPDGEGGSNTYHYNVHDNALSGTQSGAWAPTDANIYNSYNNYGMMWTPTNITFYFDGQEVGQEATPADMNVPMYMMANLAVGGSWPGLATGETSQMKIDYIRAFSSNAAIPAMALQPVSSPDGGGTNLYGATYAGMPTPTPTPTPSPTPTPTPTPTPSPNDTVVKAGSTAAIIDVSGNKWTITSGGQVAVNGTPDAITSNVTELAYVNGTIWQENVYNLWWGETQPNDSWAPTAGTSTSPLPTTPTPVVINVPASEASVSVTVNNAMINATSGNHLFFISGNANTFNLSGGIESITDSGSGGNSFKLPAAGNGSAVFNAPVLTNGDVFDLKAALAATNWTGSSSSLGSYLHPVTSGANTELLVSTTAGGKGAGTLLATFDNQTVKLSTILAHSIT